MSAALTYVILCPVEGGAVPVCTAEGAVIEFPDHSAATEFAATLRTNTQIIALPPGAGAARI